MNGISHHTIGPRNLVQQKGISQILKFVLIIFITTNLKQGIYFLQEEIKDKKRGIHKFVKQ